MNATLYRFNFKNICQPDQLDYGGVESATNDDSEITTNDWIVKVFSEYVRYHYFNMSNITSQNKWIPKEDDSLEIIVERLLASKQDHIFYSFQDALNKLNPRLNENIYNKLLVKNLTIVSAYLLIIIVSLFGNTLVLFIILSHPRLRAQTTNKLIANLTFSDFLLTTLNIPLTIVRLLSESWPLGNVFCKLGPLVQAMSVYVSTISMVVIAIDRHQVLLGSLPNRLSSSLPSIWTIIAIWVLAGLFSVPHFIYNQVVYKQTYTCVERCQAIYPSPVPTYSRAITLFTFFSQYLIPLSIITFCYTQIGIHIWKRVSIGAMTRVQKFSHLQSKRRTIKMLILVVIVFAACWLPLHIYHFYVDFMPNSTYSKPIFTLCHWFGISSVCYNPFIYFWLNKLYKKRARAILRMCFCWNRCRPTHAKSVECERFDTSSSNENAGGKVKRHCKNNEQIFILKEKPNSGPVSSKRCMLFQSQEVVQCESMDSADGQETRGGSVIRRSTARWLLPPFYMICFQRTTHSEDGQCRGVHKRESVCRTETTFY